MKVKEKSETAGLKLNIQKTKIMASSPITSWQREREKVETVTDFIFMGSKFTLDGDCSHEMKNCLLLGRRAGGGGLVAKLHLTLETPWTVTLLGSSVHGILQVRILEWVAISFSRGSS